MQNSHNENITSEQLLPATVPPVVSVVARSGTGKTTLLEKLIAEFCRRGYRVGALKHDAHHFEIDRPGKDSWRLTQAGAATTVITSPQKTAMVKHHADRIEPPLTDTLARYFGDVDLVLTEGFKASSLPKVEVHRQSLGASLLCRGERRDPTLLAVASDAPLVLDVPVFHIDDAGALCDFLIERLLP